MTLWMPNICPMPFKYCYYVHHHGSGHVMRAIEIAKSFHDQQITFMGSDLLKYARHLPDNVNCVHLPYDTPSTQDTEYISTTPSFLHYAPLRVSGLINRNALIVDFFRRNPNTLLVVDVSVEICLLARLCGIPTVVIRQSGQRTDVAHRIAYEAAELIIAPFPELLDSESDNPAMHKTYYAGGFSRYTNVTTKNTFGQDVAIFIGQGGTNIDDFLIRHIRQQLDPFTHLHIIGATSDLLPLEKTTYYDKVHDPSDILATCDVVICNAGHNTIMELADLRKHIICLPAERPFNEQLQKAQYLEQVGCAITVLEKNVYRTDWNECVAKARTLDTTQLAALTNKDAVNNIKRALDHTYNHLLTTASSQNPYE